MVLAEKCQRAGKAAARLEHAVIKIRLGQGSIRANFVGDVIQKSSLFVRESLTAYVLLLP